MQFHKKLIFSGISNTYFNEEQKEFAMID